MTTSRTTPEAPACFLCHNRNSVFFAKKSGHTLYRCLSCGLIFLYPVAESYASLYDEDYFTGAKKGYGYPNYDEEKKEMASTFDIYLTLLERRTQPKTLLDVGAANGFFMDRASARGWEVSGIEISSYARALIAQRGFRTFADLESAEKKGATFTAIALLDTIEHLRNPISDLRVMRKLLAPEGFLIVNTPNGGSVWARLLGPRWPLLVPPEHIYIFNKKNLKALLEREGFSVRTIKSIGKKFTLRYIFRLLANGNPSSRILTSLANFFESYAIGHLSIWLNVRDNMFFIAQKS